MKKSTGLLGCALFLSCSGAYAAPITYNIDQAFWGQYSATTLYTALEWQAQRQAQVDANPSAYNFLTGSITLDWDTQTFADFAFSMDEDINGVATVANFASTDPTSSANFVENTGAGSVQVNLRMMASWGPELTFGSDTAPQYRASLDVSITRFLDTGDLTLVMYPTETGEFQLFQIYDFETGTFSQSGSYDDNGSNPVTRTNGGGYGISEANAVIPLPAGLPLLGGALGLFAMMGWRNRRRASS